MLPGHFIFFEKSYLQFLKPSISSHSKSRTRRLRCFVLEHTVFKTKHLRSLIRGFELLEILGFTRGKMLAIILENKVGQNLKLEKIMF